MMLPIIVPKHNDNIINAVYQQSSPGFSGDGCKTPGLSEAQGDAPSQT